MKKIWIIIISLILITVVSLVLILNRKERVDYYKIMMDTKTDKKYSLKVQISKINNGIVDDTDLNYLIENSNYTLDIYKSINGVKNNTFYQRYNGKYYKGVEECKKFEYADYELYFNVLKYIESIKDKACTLDNKKIKEIFNLDNPTCIVEEKNNLISKLSLVSDGKITYNIEY